MEPFLFKLIQRHRCDPDIFRGGKGAELSFKPFKPILTDRFIVLRVEGCFGGVCEEYGVLGVCYKPEGRGFDSRCHWIFQLT
jgi:hypothetical protein